MPPHRNYVPAEDAVQVSRLKAGALYTQLLISGSLARFPTDSHEQPRTRAAGLSAAAVRVSSMSALAG